jgi:tetratricopeptide (TPR) repeat protein
MILFRRGESERAIADYTAALTCDDNYAPALRGRGMAHLYRGATDLAIADLSKAILLAENDPNRLSALDLFLCPAQPRCPLWRKAAVRQ